MRPSISCSGSLCQSVIFGSLTLRNTKHAILGGFNFSKFRMEPVMFNFLATTENIRKIRSEHLIYNCGKVPKKAAGNCYSQFPDTK